MTTVDWLARQGWQHWFAWHPVKLSSGRWTWLQEVQRRRYTVWPDEERSEYRAATVESYR